MNIVKVSSKGQITLPQTMLNGFGIRPYDQVLLEQRRDEIIIKPINSSVSQELAGCLTPLVHPSLLNASLTKIMKETKIKVSRKLAGKK